MLFNALKAGLGGPSIGGMLGIGATTASANGNVFSGGNVVAAFADGGVVDGATTVPMALMGEAGPEAIMPLSRGPDGKLGIAGGGGGGSNAISIHNSITVNGDSPGNTQKNIEQAKLISDMVHKQVQSTIMKESMPGGSLSRSQQRY
jgi:phage-related minor tail protein